MVVKVKYLVWIGGSSNTLILTEAYKTPIMSPDSLYIIIGKYQESPAPHRASVCRQSLTPLQPGQLSEASKVIKHNHKFTQVSRSCFQDSFNSSSKQFMFFVKAFFCAGLLGIFCVYCCNYNCHYWVADTALSPLTILITGQTRKTSFTILCHNFTRGNCRRIQ